MLITLQTVIQLLMQVGLFLLEVQPVAVVDSQIEMRCQVVLEQDGFLIILHLSKGLYQLLVVLGLLVVFLRFQLLRVVSVAVVLQEIIIIPAIDGLVVVVATQVVAQVTMVDWEMVKLVVELALS